MKLRSGLSVESFVPMASMADVALLLIIFFMLTSTFAHQSGINVSLPKAETSAVLPTKEINISVKSDGSVFINDKAVALAQLRPVLKQELEQNPRGGVTILGDEGVPYGTIVTVMDDAKMLGAEIILATEYSIREGEPIPEGAEVVSSVQ